MARWRFGPPFAQERQVTSRQGSSEKQSMDARWVRAACLAAGVSSLGADQSWGAGHRTPNFVVQAATPEIAEQVGEAAEQFRRDLALEWLGRAMPNWTH